MRGTAFSGDPADPKKKQQKPPTVVSIRFIILMKIKQLKDDDRTENSHLFGFVCLFVLCGLRDGHKRMGGSSDGAPGRLTLNRIATESVEENIPDRLGMSHYLLISCWLYLYKPPPPSPFKHRIFLFSLTGNTHD